MSMPSLASQALPAGHVARADRAALRHIPGDEGWPVVGRTFNVLADPLGEARRMAKRFGPVYRSRLLGETSIALLGPEANEFVYLDQTKLFSSTHGWDSILGLLFPRGLMLLDFDEHRLHRRALSVAFKAGPMKSYLAQLDAGIAARVAQWRHSPGEMLFYPAMKQLTLDLAATSFLGTDIGAETTEVTQAFVDMVAASVAVVRKPLPGTQMARGVAGRKRIVAYFSEQIPIRRARGGDDLFSQLCQATHEDGALLSTQDIVDHMSFLTMAAHDTLTSSLTSLVYFLAADPQWQERLRAEVAALGLAAGEPLPFDKLEALPLTEMAFKEAMRLNPPVPSMPRRATRDFTFRGFTIPAGTLTGVNTLYTHHMPELWPEPEIFDPLRFTDEAQRARHRFAYVPFGGGAHMCLGLHFAYMQAKCFAVHVLRNLDVSIAPGYKPAWQMWPIPKPRDGLKVTLAARG
ncbi:cytochrome P450 [Bradyrhizobium sp. U87765 SZCCT0131]|uniref:cytochrome P450 n=1 Tax=unclassified Bradyrhizobium TaxID=2631580 RepID=UPI001BA75648|nr:MULTISPECIES: cytochrome P450 [unclassified Bradyrhizobium]MBR1217650.1 cytochrome P450 [Bradyrhizobium sp. U87765 SZCCT0131]MBR1261404.1 cytochrome P450 [Bradyrhizobium sp. U87765 SZCCT0134]MBR1303148.1 cytochrome P450 [Bradyrhizobium sp. U87765 SZCCT0110]MBR1318754.1 cytochrome P450 [Bradyrhizobium sp. U87765 SZCCT0109]MBR1347079.1 cytochrome P450 [Bradyrhizobium sp. U87765 SZCCT0048]